MATHQQGRGGEAQLVEHAAEQHRSQQGRSALAQDPGGSSADELSPQPDRVDWARATDDHVGLPQLPDGLAQCLGGGLRGRRKHDRPRCRAEQTGGDLGRGTDHEQAGRRGPAHGPAAHRGQLVRQGLDRPVSLRPRRPRAHHHDVRQRPKQVEDDLVGGVVDRAGAAVGAGDRAVDRRHEVGSPPVLGRRVELGELVEVTDRAQRCTVVQDLHRSPVVEDHPHDHTPTR
nr:hypothetical protein [Arsenicicoccus bolidensis]